MMKNKNRSKIENNNLRILRRKQEKKFWLVRMIPTRNLEKTIITTTIIEKEVNKINLKTDKVIEATNNKALILETTKETTKKN